MPDFLQTFSFNSCNYSNISKYVFLKISQDLHGNTCAGVSFVIKPQAACNSIKEETPVQVFSCEFCRVSKYTFFYRTPLTTASHNIKLENIIKQIFKKVTKKLVGENAEITGNYRPPTVICSSNIVDS